MKVVADTMMWVSYCTSKNGFRHRLIERARRQRVRFFVSGYILDELTDTLVEDLELSKRFARLARQAVLRAATQITLPDVIGSFVERDPDDNPIVQTALSAKADYLVTADTVMLRLHKVQDVQIITAERFEELLQ